MKIVSDWRVLHLGPLNEVRAIVKRRLENLGVKYLLAQRLKRMPSIIDKQKRFDSLELSRMQDVAGLRIVEPTIDDIKKFMTDYFAKPQLYRYQTKKTT